MTRADDPETTLDRVTSSDALLVERLQRRDPEALAVLFDRCGRRAFALAFRVTGNGGEAEDAVQEAFIDLWERAPRLGVAGRLDSLVLTIVHRRAIDRVRRRRPAQLLATVEAAEQADEAAATAMDRMLDSLAAPQLQADLRAALAGLPAEQRAVLDLAFIGGLTQPEIAARLAIPVGTVKSRVRLGMQKMRAALEALGYP